MMHGHTNQVYLELLNTAFEWTQLLRTQKVLGSNLGPKPSYSEIISWFISVSSGKRRKARTISFCISHI
jgi:hypothetical protein